MARKTGLQHVSSCAGKTYVLPCNTTPEKTRVDQNKQRTERALSQAQMRDVAGATAACKKRSDMPLVIHKCLIDIAFTSCTKLFE